MDNWNFEELKIVVNNYTSSHNLDGSEFAGLDDDMYEDVPD